MSVYRTDYIIYGWKLSHSKEDSRFLKDESKESYKYFDGGYSGYELIIDDMAGHFIVFGKVLYKNDYPYANTASDKPLEFSGITLPSVEDKEEIMRKYMECFSVNKPIEESPCAFIFSHIY